MTNIKSNLLEIQNTINLLSQQYAKQNVALLAVSKTKSVEEIETAFSAGQLRFGENYVQEAIQKIQFFQNKNLNIEWHFIGHLQSNKTKDVATFFDWVQTIDSIKIAQRLNNQRPNHLKPLQVLIQVNISQEQTKSGILGEQEIFTLAKQIASLPNLNLRGLMAIPAPIINSDNPYAIYIKMQNLFQKLQQAYPTNNIDTLSLGMSDDMQIAIQHGSTMVRIGSAIFGSRI